MTLDPATSHPTCWTGDRYVHTCHRPSGRRCLDCGEPAGTPWGPLWCPDCDVVRLDRVGAQLRALAAPQVNAFPSSAGDA